MKQSEVIMSVLSSRRLWTFILAQVVSIAVFVIGHYLTDPFAMQLSVMVVGFVEGLGGILIVAFTIDDVKLNAASMKADTEIQKAAIEAGTHPDFQGPCK